MKRFYKTALLALIGNMAMAQSFFVPTTYRGAFEPAPTPMWTDNWTNWDPQNTAYPTPDVIVTTSITTNTTWTNTHTYLLQGQIYVKNGATLTIEPGTIIEGDKASTGAGLFICQGSQLIAQGTVMAPIIFTSNQAPGARSIGDWGGVILMGKASNNNPGGIANIEGIAPTADTQYGGGTSPDDDDNSGILQYVRIEFPGYVYAPNKEINGLTFGAVGRGTTIDHIQISFSNDDSYEWFGGTVNCRYLVAYRGLDDDFDTDNGFSGHVQFGLAVRDPNIADNPSVSTSEGFESDNDAAGDTFTPQTSAIFSNMTLIGPYRGNTASTIASGYRRGARLRRNTALKIYNTIFMDHVYGIHIDGALCEGNAASGVLKYKNNICAGNSTGKVCQVNSGSTFNITSWFGANSNDSLASTTGILITPYNYLAPDYRPAAGSPALTNYDFSDVSLAPYVLVAPTVTSTVAYCQNATAATLSATAGPGNTLNWYTSATGGTPSTTAPTPVTSIAGTTTYYVAQMNNMGVEGPRASITVTVNPLPTAPVITPSGSTSFCTGGSVTLSSSYSSGNTWSTAATTQNINVTSSGTFNVTETDGNGCSSTSSDITVNVSSAPLPTIATSGATTLCSGETVTLTSSAADSYSWSNGATTQSITVSTGGTYNVTTTNSNACDGVGTSANTTVTVNPVPTAAGSTASIAGSVVTFTNSSTGATSYNWNFGDASSSSATNPVHAYATNGTYTVTLIASNGSCNDTVSFIVSITVGIQELANINEARLYPNPANEVAILDLELSASSTVQAYIYDITGKLVNEVYKGELPAGKTTLTIDASNLEAGSYYTTVVTNGSRKTMKLIIVK